MLPGIDSILHFCPECGQQGGEPKARNFRGRHSWMETPYANVQLSEAGGRALTDQGPLDHRPCEMHFSKSLGEWTSSARAGIWDSRRHDSTCPRHEIHVCRNSVTQVVADQQSSAERGVFQIASVLRFEASCQYATVKVISQLNSRGNLVIFSNSYPHLRDTMHADERASFKALSLSPFSELK